MDIQAVIFDFDGLILETEVPEFQSWQEIYRHYGASLQLSTWLPFLGTGASSSPFDIYEHLETQIGYAVSREEIRARRRPSYLALVEAQPINPGVEAIIQEAQQLGVRLGVASSSSREWVVGHLTRLQLAKHFDCIVCGDEVAQSKPHPDVYCTALARLGVQAEQAIALEDSPNGVLAARRAGLFCIAVPNPLTAAFPFEHANVQLASLAELSLKTLLSNDDGHPSA